MDGPTYFDGKGYIDRFKEDINDYINILPNGELLSVNSDGPGDYMIIKMRLNRVNRVYLRKKRILHSKLLEVREIINREMDAILSCHGLEKSDPDNIINKIKILTNIKREYESIL
ncbi:hypothetical protein ADP73_02600 [Serratia plymuthica]|nr:hypothetical protein ADP73_02600 [Serratia plymuthica]